MANCIPLVVLDWMVLEEGKYVREGKSSVRSMTNITAPRKEYNAYKVGDEVMAKFSGKTYKATIIAIGTPGM